MNNEPVAWMQTWENQDGELKQTVNIEQIGKNDISLYTQDQLEEARKLGMQQERAMWKLAASTQEIMDTHPVKEHFEDEPQAEELHEILQSNTHPVKEQDESFDRTASHMAGEYVSYQKELTDEEIREVAKSVEDEGYAQWKYEFAKAIMKKAQEK